MIIPNWQKLLGCCLYLLPWSDGINFGRYLFQDFPFLEWLKYLALPIWFVEQMIPLGLGSLALFLIIFLAVARNPQVPYFLRFNALQALLINIGIFLLNYAFVIFIQPLGGRLIVSTLASTIFIAILTIIIFTFGECLQGKEPDLPGISEAVRMQL
tara:strand:- start:77 stop:544 length:468 start_codon:yes stop_codon:yes gene_type:complete